MDMCQACGHKTAARSPTGDWCNRCGWMSPCPCEIGQYCPAHDEDHAHEWADDGSCKTKHCPAKLKFQDAVPVEE